MEAGVCELGGEGDQGVEGGLGGAQVLPGARWSSSRYEGLAVQVPDVADNGFVLRHHEVLAGEDALAVNGGGAVQGAEVRGVEGELEGACTPRTAGAPGAAGACGGRGANVEGVKGSEGVKGGAEVRGSPGFLD